MLKNYPVLYNNNSEYPNVQYKEQFLTIKNIEI
jgi:hypothetical protein